MFRGDVDRFYCRLRRRWPTPPAGKLPDLDHVRSIHEYYAAMEPGERLLLLAWAKKEESGIGLIPAALSAIPLIGLLFVPLIQQAIGHLCLTSWLAIWGVAGSAFVAGFYVHQRQRAYTTLHIEVLTQLCGPCQQTQPPKGPDH